SPKLNHATADGPLHRVGHHSRVRDQHDQDQQSDASGRMGTVTSRRDFLAGVAGVTAVMASRSVPLASAMATPPRFMYVGSFTAKDGGHGDGLGVYRRNGESDPWTQVQL